MNQIQTTLMDYDGFVDKFVPKKTTDDCYTPQPVYDEVLKFVGELTDLTGREIVRPFWPGGDFERYDYPKGCIVVDNPPFSIYAKIVRFYLAHNIDFFRTFLVLEGSEGDSFAGRVADESLFYVLHSHAINRYVERHRFGGTLEEAQRTILNGLMINDVQKDGTDETMYIHFDGGIFLCTISDRVLHLRTFIMNRQCSQIQRMKSLTSEKNTKKMKREFGLK